MTATISRKPDIRRRKKYQVGGLGTHHAYADTLAEAKELGTAIAKRVVWRGQWNVLFITIPILVADAPSSARYTHTGWRMYVPVRGSGVRAKTIIDKIRSRHGVAPMVWVKEGK